MNNIKLDFSDCNYIFCKKRIFLFFVVYILVISFCERKYII